MHREVERTLPESTVRNWQSVRTILEGLILLSIWAMWNGQGLQRETTVEIKAQMAAMRESLSSLQTQLAGIPAISQSMARIEVKLDEHERRISRMESGGK
jgi:hypothetical protein